MTEIPDAAGADYAKDARRAILRAVRDEHDFGGWLAGVLASVAAELGSTFALTVGRPGFVGGRPRAAADQGDRRLGRRLPRHLQGAGRMTARLGTSS